MKNSYADSLANTTWGCKCILYLHQNLEEKEVFGTLRRETGMILRELYRRKLV